AHSSCPWSLVRIMPTFGRKPSLSITGVDILESSAADVLKTVGALIINRKLQLLFHKFAILGNYKSRFLHPQPKPVQVLVKKHFCPTATPKRLSHAPLVGMLAAAF